MVAIRRRPAICRRTANLRIAAKRLRYTLELFRFAFPGSLVSLIDDVKEIQEHIGNMHDADVMIERMLETIGTDSANRVQRLTDIAMAVERGTVAQRHQRLRSAMNSRTTPRDEVAFYTLIAHRSDDRQVAYDSFVQAWRQMEASDFPKRLRRHVGLLPPEPEPEPDPESKSIPQPDVSVDSEPLDVAVVGEAVVTP